jgi:hypothetical protein
MGWFEVHQSPKTTAAALLLAATVAPCTVDAQSALEPVAADEQQRQIIEQITEEQAQNGPHSAALLGPLTALALIYEESEAYGLASAALDRALQVIRVNDGVHSLDQAPLLRQRIRHEEVRGDFATAWHLEQELLSLAKRHSDDLRTVPIFREIADKRMDLLERYLAGELPPQLFLGCYYDATSQLDKECDSGSRRGAARAMLADAQTNYEEAIAVMLRHRLYSSDELRELEMELIRSSDLVRDRKERSGEDLARVGSQKNRTGTRIAATPLNYYYVGRQSLGRLVSYEFKAAAPSMSRIDAVIRLADWDLLYAGHALAHEGYEYAYAALRELGAAQESIEIFSPKMPVVLPTFLPNPLASDETETAKGFIDVAFEITKYGTSRRVAILDTTTNATDDDKERLITLVRRSQFRPRVTDGQLAEASPVVVRYYLNE